MKKENVNELIYNYYQKDEYALKEIIEFYRPMVIKILQEKCDFQDNRTAIYKDVLSRADYLLVKCLEHFRYGYNGSFTSFYRRSLTIWLLMLFEAIHVKEPFRIKCFQSITMSKKIQNT